MDPSKINQLVKDIKKKKELNSIDDNFVREYLSKVLIKNFKEAKLLEENFSQKSNAYHEIIKSARKDLRKCYGLFRQDSIKTDLFKDLLKNPRNKTLTEKVLAVHSSTRERLPYYEELYQKIFTVTGKPKVILDLGCGANPFSLMFMKVNAVYYAYDISRTEIDQINTFFKAVKQKGVAEIMDITKEVEFPKADLALLFKITDVIDQGRGHKGTEEVIKRLPTRFVVVSFPTLTMNGKPMNAPRRRWMEWLCNRLNYKFKIIEIPNEIFYILEK